MIFASWFLRKEKFWWVEPYSKASRKFRIYNSVLVAEQLILIENNIYIDIYVSNTNLKVIIPYI